MTRKTWRRIVLPFEFDLFYWNLVIDLLRNTQKNENLRYEFSEKIKGGGIVEYRLLKYSNAAQLHVTNQNVIFLLLHFVNKRLEIL